MSEQVPSFPPSRINLSKSPSFSTADPETLLVLAADGDLRAVPEEDEGLPPHILAQSPQPLHLLFSTSTVWPVTTPWPCSVLVLFAVPRGDVGHVVVVGAPEGEDAGDAVRRGERGEGGRHAPGRAVVAV
ncbi:hypothetical protein DL765_007367 [Monosporascus sp. GIB2]|nr:hypothetical protein DL765_007367 [Monosporascus sp. GIB2]